MPTPQMGRRRPEGWSARWLRPPSAPPSPAPSRRIGAVIDVTHHTWVHENLKKLIEGFHYDAHPMGMLVSGVAALSTFYPEAKDGANAETRRLLPYNYPDNDGARRSGARARRALMSNCMKPAGRAKAWCGPRPVRPFVR